jgi:hypothetical protein
VAAVTLGLGQVSTPEDTEKSRALKRNLGAFARRGTNTRLMHDIYPVHKVTVLRDFRGIISQVKTGYDQFLMETLGH